MKFEEERREKSFFSDDTVSQRNQTIIFFDTTGKIVSLDNKVEMEGYQGRSVFNNHTVYLLESDSTYTFVTETRPPIGLW